MDKLKKGYIKLYRCIEDDWLWEIKPFGHGQAWIDLLMMANFEQKKIMFNKKPLTLEKGSFITSVRKLSERWGWSKNKVLRFLNTLEDDKKIIRDSDKMRTLITLVNYKDFQRKRDTNGDSDGDSDEDTNGDTDEDTSEDTNGDSDGDSDEDTNGDTDEDTSEDTNGDSDGTQTINKEYKEYKTLQENYIVGKPDAHLPEIEEIINFLNEKTGNNYRADSKQTQRYINARLNDGYTVDNFKKVIEVKTKDWLTDPKMRKYLRPKTLFSAENFESYLNEATAKIPEKYPGLTERMKKRNEEILKDFVDDGRFN